MIERGQEILREGLKHGTDPKEVGDWRVRLVQTSGRGGIGWFGK